MKEDKKLKFNLETLLYIYIIACPILDMTSYIFRNTFDTNFSPSTVVRPIIAIISIIYIFFKNKIKTKLFATGLIYGIYAVAHLAVFKTLQSNSSYSTIVHELQYLVNYTFMVLNLFIYIYVFKDKEKNNLKKCILVSSIIYIVSIYMAILTGTSSSTYITGMGFKGWFESGNSISAILTLLLFILLTMINDKNYRLIILGTALAIGVFLTTLIGTRVGLFGFVLVIGVYLLIEIIISLFKKIKIDKKIVIGGILAICGVLLMVLLLGSNTIERRKQLEVEAVAIIDDQTNEVAHITGDLMEIKSKIESNTLEEGFMNEPEQKAVLDLYDIAKEKGLTNTQRRNLQLIYNYRLVLNQSNLIYVLVGNGYMNQFYEMVLEMEIPAFLFNFGIVGFILYFIPFFGVFMYAVYMCVKNIKRLDSEYLMLLAGSGFIFVLSFFSGYIFFNASTMMIGIIINTLLIMKINKFKEFRKEGNI